MEDGHSRPLVERAQEYWNTRLGSIPPQSTEEYFALLLDRALRAQRMGDGGISAALAVRCHGFEIVSFGCNTVFSQRDPLGHAEVNAIRRLRDLITPSSSAVKRSISPWTNTSHLLHSDEDIFIRKTRDSCCQSVLYTTLEPCPMCTVALITAGVDSVFIAVSDESTGALASGRLDFLPTTWPELARRQNIQVYLSSSSPVDAPNFMPPELTSMLSEVFLTSHEKLESRIVHEGILSASTVCGAVSELAARDKFVTNPAT